MTTELRFLLLSCALGLVQLLAGAGAVVLQHGIGYGLSSRDQARPLEGMGGRLGRAFDNFRQSFPVFAAAILVGQVLDRHSVLTVLGAQLYFWGRLAFVPLYAFNVVGVRTLAFGVSFVGIVLVLYGVA